MRSGDVSAALMMHAHVTEFQPFVRKKQHLPTNGGRCRTLTRPSSYIFLILQKKKKKEITSTAFLLFSCLFLFSWILLTLCVKRVNAHSTCYLLVRSVVPKTLKVLFN